MPSTVSVDDVVAIDDPAAPSIGRLVAGDLGTAVGGQVPAEAVDSSPALPLTTGAAGAGAAAATVIAVEAVTMPAKRYCEAARSLFCWPPYSTTAGDTVRRVQRVVPVADAAAQLVTAEFSVRPELFRLTRRPAAEMVRLVDEGAGTGEVRAHGADRAGSRAARNTPARACRTFRCRRCQERLVGAQTGTTLSAFWILLAGEAVDLGADDNGRGSPAAPVGAAEAATWALLT
ncbi:MAG: hypothetical protein R2697_00780 [Ilumatobacteraceae bacterium]